jgi:hypothetical protein
VEKKQINHQIERVRTHLSVIKRVSQNHAFGCETLPTLASCVPLKTPFTDFLMVCSDAKLSHALALLDFIFP